MCGSRWPGLQDAGAADDRRSRTALSDSMQAARREIEQRQRAGARELRHVVGRLERLLAVHRHRERQAAQRGEADDRAERRDAQPHAKRIEPPEQHQQRQRRCRQRRATSRRRLGKIVSRNETVSASISMTSTKLALMIRMSCLNCDSRISTTTMMSDSDAATAGRRSNSEPDEVEKPPGEQEGQPGDEVVFGVQQDGRAPPDAAAPARQCPNDGGRRPGRPTG